MKKDIASQIIKIIRKKYKQKNIDLHTPYLNGNEKKYLNISVSKNYISTFGPYVEKFEKKLKNFTKSKYVICLNNGTSALQLAIKSLNLKANDEILVPSLNFISSTNAAIYCNAVPHFVEVDENNLGIDIYKLDNYLKKITIIKNNKCFNKKTGNYIRAIIPTHVFGNISNINEILKLKKKYKLFLIEDSAEALGSFYKKKHAGTFGDLGILSFNGNKIITTGGGGAILTNNKKLAKKIRNLSTLAKYEKNFRNEYGDVGYNYRMPNINASLGNAQIEMLEKILKIKKNIFNFYKKEFKIFSNIRLIAPDIDCKSNHWINHIQLKNIKEKNVNNILKQINLKKIFVKKMWCLVNSNQKYKKYPSMSLKISKKLSKNIICLPSGPNLK